MKLFFLGTHLDQPYLPRLKACVGTAVVSYSLEPITTWAEVKFHCDKKGITNVFSTSAALLKILLHKQAEKKSPSLDNYAGSLFTRDGITIVFVNPLAHLVSVSYGEHLLRRYLSKLTSPSSWIASPAFEWEIVTATNAERLYNEYAKADLIAVDIETNESCSITCIGYTAVYMGSGTIRTHSCVLPMDSEFNLAWMRRFNSLAPAKILQNGKYDCAYLARYSAPLYNYLWDTINLFHCWYSEMPKDLAFIQSYCVRESMYWKDLAKTTDQHEYYLYNAKDTHATAVAFLSMMKEMPQYARDNYLQEFPLVFPTHLCEMTGIQRDMARLEVAATAAKEAIATDNATLDKMLGVTNFNVNSPIQMKALLKILGCADLESADEKNLSKAAYRHPLNSRIIDRILEVRGNRKLLSTYLTAGKEFNGTILYSLNPHGTDTGRLASKEHHFWCGLQIQNILRGVAVKQTLRARDGYRLAEVDLEQAESRDTAYISGDESLQAAVSGTRDFHSVNASAFFGMPYESIYDDAIGKTLNKPLRDLAKRVNHGANYNMGEGVLVETMGLSKVFEAAVLLRLPRIWQPKQIAGHLLGQFHKTYPKLKTVYYAGVIYEIKTTHCLTSKARHDCDYQATLAGWTRYCFGKPDLNKRDLNAYVAHSPQSLNAMTLNKAFLNVFYKIAINPIHSKHFRLLAQIHDSILFEFKAGHEYLAEEVRKCMEIPVTVTGYDGISRTFTVPAAIKAGKDGKGSLYWSETE